jgi:hypothetical protein
MSGRNFKMSGTFEGHSLERRNDMTSFNKTSCCKNRTSYGTGRKKLPVTYLATLRPIWSPWCIE